MGEASAAMPDLSMPEPSSITPPNPPTTGPVIKPQLPLTTRLRYFVSVWAFKAFVYLALGTMRLARARSRAPSQSPTYLKTYPSLPSTPARVFVPPSYRNGDKPLPLYIDVHGGGFTICDPQLDDDFCAHMANRHGICMVSIGYRLAPRASFPTPVHDVGALAAAVLEDLDLPVDRDKVAFGGFSAGGNLSFAAVQLPQLKGRVHAMVSFYPAVDFARTVDKKLADRPAHVQHTQDPLAQTGKWFNWAYVPAGTDLTDPLLSPAYAKREDLPRKCALVGCELDMLCREAMDMAESLAEGQEGVGEKVLDGEGQRGWERGSVRWEAVLGAKHGFDQIEQRGAKEVARLERRGRLYDGIAGWLWREVYS